MRIVIDARMMGGFGIGRYNRNLIANLQKIDKKNEYFILHKNKEFQEANYPPNFKKVLADFHWYGLREQVYLPRLINSLRPDIVHFPHFNIPVLFRGKFIVTIHDLIHQHFQLKRATTHGALMYKIKTTGYNIAFSQAIKRSKKIITPSNYVRNCLIEEWGVDSKKISRTYEGVEDVFLRKASKKGSGEALKKFGVKKPYIYYVGNASPHKNVEGLIKTFLNLRQKYQYLQLVLSGSDDFFWERLKKEYPNPNIIYTGFVSDLEMIELYREANVYVVPSLEEGFGIPVLEAMACSTPVVSSSRASLPEVGGDSCLYFDPENLADMENKIKQVLDSNKLAQELSKKGLERVKEFSWKKMAEETLDIYLNS